MGPISVTVTDANNLTLQVTPVASNTVTVDRGVAGNGIVSIVPVTISTFQYLRITYTNGTVQDVGPLTSTAYTATSPITIVGNTISLSTVPIASGGTGATTAATAIQNLLPSYTGNANKRLGLNSGGTALEWVLDGGGTVTSINASGGTTGLTFSGGPITTSGTLTLSGTLAVANGGTGVTTSTGTGSVVLSTSPTLVTPALGTPTSGNFSTGTFTWPTFNQNTTGTASNVTGIVAIANGGSGQSTAQLAMNAFAGAVTSGSYLRGNGTNVVMSTIQAADVPTLNQNTTGTAANVTGVVAIANGGTGQTTANTAFNALAPTQTGNSGKFLTTDGSNTSWATNPLGTVTSVAATVPSFLSISGSPITTSGTLAFSLSGTALPTTSGGTGLTSFTANGVVYASSSSALATGSALTFDGTTFTSTAPTTNFSGANFAMQMGTAATYGYIGNSNSQSYLQINGSSNATPNVMIFGVASAEGMRLNSTGLGIGTSSPAYKLQVGDGSADTRGLFLSNNNFSIGVGRSTGTIGGYIGSPSSDVMVFSGNGGAEKMRIDSSGNLGIGTSSPSQKLEVAGNAKLTGTNLSIVPSTATSAAYLLNTNTGGNFFLGIDSSTGASFTGTAYGRFLYSGGAYPMVFLTNDTERARIDSSGNLLVGTTDNGGTNTQGLEVYIGSGATRLYIGHASGTANGTQYAVFNYAGTNQIGSISQSGTTAVLYNVTSDQRLKENIQDADSASTLIDSLQVRKFDWITDKTHQRYGFVAQELVTVAPEAVHQPEDTEQMMAVDYSKLVPMLVKEIQSLRVRLAVLEAK